MPEARSLFIEMHNAFAGTLNEYCSSDEIEIYENMFCKEFNVHEGDLEGLEIPAEVLIAYYIKICKDSLTDKLVDSEFH